MYVQQIGDLNQIYYSFLHNNYWKLTQFLYKISEKD